MADTRNFYCPSKVDPKTIVETRLELVVDTGSSLIFRCMDRSPYPYVAVFQYHKDYEVLKCNVGKRFRLGFFVPGTKGFQYSFHKVLFRTILDAKLIMEESRHGV